MNVSPKHNSVFTKIGPVEHVPINDVSPPQKMLRVYKARHIKHAAKTLQATGMVAPIIVDRTGIVVAGVIFYLAAKQLELPEIPVIRASNLSEAQVEIYRIAEQRLAEIAPWDEVNLSESLKFLSDLDLDVDLEATGFSTTEIDLKLGSLESHSKKDQTPVEENEVSLSETAVSEIGDLWILGKNRLLCGDSLLKANYELLLAGASASAMLSDPPFNVKVSGHVMGSGKIQHREFAMASGEMTNEEFQDFLRTWLKHAIEHLRSGALLYVFMDWRHALHLLSAAHDLALELKNICVWAKTNAGMGSMYRSQHELVFIFKSGKGAHRNNIELGRHGRNRTNVWTYPGANSFERNSEEGNLLGFHPTTKPVQMLADVMLDCTARNSVILDSFVGSGSSLLAAERVGRKLYGIEIDPLYVDLTIRRWERLTGLQATHATSGRSFKAISTERLGS